MERDLAHEYDMEMLRREQLRADVGDDYNEFPDPTDDEYKDHLPEPMDDLDEWDWE